LTDEELSDFGRIWPQHVASLTRFLIDCRRNFDGDIDLFLVLCIIGDRTFPAHRARSAMDFETSGKTNAKGLKSEDVNPQSISDFSGIPRETVRRKLKALFEKGWVARDERGVIIATTKAKNDLAPLTMSTIAYLAQMKKALTGA
jgi:hypothetical protein